MMKRTRVAVMFGGRSVEHEISIITGLQLIRAIDVVDYEPIPVYISASGRWYSGSALLETSFYKNMPASFDLVSEVTLLPIPNLGGLTVMQGAKINGKTAHSQSEGGLIPVDVFFPTFHGSYGEDGCIQGLLEMAEVTYTGSRVLASALSMSKEHCKEIVAFNQVPVLPSLVVSKREAQRELGKGLVKLRERILSTKGFEQFPLFIKPCNLGSSIGVARATNVDELDAALVQAFKYDTVAMVEPCLDNKLEINVAVLDDGGVIASVCEIPVSSSGKELTYEDKYMRGGGAKKTGNLESQGMAALTRVIDPQDLSPEIKKSAQDYAKKAFQSLNCAGVARIDFMLDLGSGKLYFNEINPLPGSMAFYLWTGSHPPIFYTDLLTRIIERARQAQEERMSLSRDIGFKAMFKST
jgi:D-alanine-D-alanine ligase